MTTKFEFACTLHRNRGDMLAAIAQEFITAGGANDAATVTSILADSDADTLAAECIRDWGLDQPTVETHDDMGDWVSHMELNDYSAEDLADAIREFAATRPDVNDDDLSEGDDLSEIDLADLDGNLRADLDGADKEWTAWTAPRPGATVGNQQLHIVHHAGARRGGIVMVGSGSSGQTYWTDAADPAEVLRRYLTDDLRN